MARIRDRDVDVLAATVLALAFGEELWQSFLPAYLVALGGTATVVGLFGSCRDLLDGAYQIPGGWVSDRLGARAAIKLFIAYAIVGYACYAAAWSWPIAFLGLAGAMAWKAGAFPATFALIGERLPQGRRVGGFTLQSIAVRLPRVIAAPIGGALLWRLGTTTGVRVGAVAAIVLASGALVLQRRLSPAARDAPVHSSSAGVRLSGALRRLLAAECLVRIGEAVAATFVILYVTGVRRVPLGAFGLLYAMQNVVALVMYLPAARAAAAIGSRTLVAITFACFALFPLAIVWAPGTIGLIGAFVIGGLKEFGEPARKALIVDLCRPESRAREVGAYYAVRNLLVVPGGLLGGLIWQRSPSLVFETACAISAAGLLLFVATGGGVRLQADLVESG